MMVIEMLMTWWWWSMFFISLTQSLTRSLTLLHRRTISFHHTNSFFLNLCSDSVLFSLWHTLVEFPTSDCPSIHHCCPMTGKQFRLMMMIEMLMTRWWWSMSFISLTQSLTSSLSFSITCWFFRLLDSPSNDHCCPMSGDDRWRDDDDRCFSSHSLDHSLAVSRSHSH